MAALTITDATVLSVATAPERFGSDFRFGTRKNITVEVAKLDAVNSEGVGSCATTADALRKTKNWTSLTINSISFGRAKLIDFNLEEGIWVTHTKATLSFEVYEDGDLSQMAGDYYKGLNDLKANGKNLEDFSEEFTFERGPDSTSYSYTLNLKFSAATQLTTTAGCIPGEVQEAYDCAEEIIRGGAGSRPSFALIDTEVEGLYSDYGKGKKRLLRESVDLLNKTAAFTEDFTAYNIDSVDYSSIIRQSITLGEDGVVSVGENGQLLGLNTKGGDEIERELPSVDGEINDAIKPGGRLVEVFNYYKLLWDCPDIDDLITDPGGDLLVIKKGRVYDTFRGHSTYDITCTNDPKYQDVVVHEYTVTTEAINGEKGDLYRATENGSIIGKTKGEVENDTDDDGDVSWLKVKEYWADLLGANGFVEPDGGGTPRIKDILSDPSPRLVTNSITKSPWQVKISYSQMVSEAPEFAENDGYAKSITMKESQNTGTQRHKVGNVINQPNRKQVLQTRETYGRNTVAANIEMVGKRHATLDNLLDLAKNKLDDAAFWPSATKPQDSYTFIDNCNYSFSDDNDIKLNLNIGWK